MSRARSVVATALGVAAVLVLATPALATPEPGLLEASDLPNGLVQARDPQTLPEVNTFVIDAAACTQTLEPDPAAESVTVLQFANGAGSTAFTESVVTFPNAKAAKKGFKEYAATARAGVKCGSVDTEIPDAQPGTPSTSTISYEAVKFPKVAGGSYALTRGGSGPANVAASFVSGPYVVVLGTYGSDGAPTLKQLAAIAKKADAALG